MLEEIRVDVVERMRARRPEIDEVLFARVRDGVVDPAGSDDAEYIQGLRAAVVAAVDYALSGIEAGEGWSGIVPEASVVQAQRAARVGVGLDTVLRRYVAGHALLEDFVMQEVDHNDLTVGRTALRKVLGISASVLDRLIASITSVYMQELERTGQSPSGRQTEPRPVPDVMVLPAMLGAPSARRARECLCFLVERPGSNNREVAVGIGVTHQSQISRLLSCLAREDLVLKRSEGAGKRNAWWLTPRGEEIARMLERAS